MFFLAQPKASNFQVKISDKHDIVGKVVDGLEKLKVRVSIWAVNSSQN